MCKMPPVTHETLSLYGFGSYFTGEPLHNDIDLLIIHKNTTLASCQIAIACKRLLITKIINADIVILSKLEESANSFITTSKAKKIGNIRSNTIEDDINIIIHREKIPNTL